MKINSYQKKICTNDKNIYYMTQENSWIQKNNSLDKSSYYKDYLHLVEPENANFTSKYDK